MKTACLFISLLLCCTTWADEFPSLDEGRQEAPRAQTFQMVLDPKEHTILSSELTAQVVKIYKRMGDSFVSGELLVSLDKKIVEANYGKTHAKRDKAWVELEGKKRLFEKDMISLFEVKDAEAAYAEALSEAITAEKLLSAADIRACYKGKVVRLALEEYELAQPGKEIIEIVRDDYLLGHFLAPASLYNCLTLGAVLTLNIHGQEKMALVTRLSPVIDPTSGTIKVETEIDNTKTQWIPGTVGTVSVPCGR